MTHRGHRIFFLAAVLISLPLSAQTSDQRIQDLERRLDDLSAQMRQIRDEIAQLKGQPAPASTEQDLTKIEVAAPTAAPPSLTDVQTVNNIQNSGASKVFNPDTSIIGTFLGKAGRRNPYEFGSDGVRPPLSLDEAEVAFQAFVDPYAKGQFFIAVSPEGVELEEGYASFIALPHGLTAKAGKMKAVFGKDNTWHTHVRPWADQPLVIHNFFGDEGLNDSGVSVSKTIDNPWNTFIEATGEVFAGDVENVFGRRKQSDLFYNAHIKAFRDLSENSNLEVGTSFARGALANADAGHNQFAGLDLTYRWKPLQQGLYKGLIARFEGITNDRSGFDRNLRGFYTSVDYQLARRWFGGLRFDSADRAVDFDRFHDRGTSATLTFWPSEFSQIRGQLRRTRYGGVDRAINEFLLQMQFSIGAHGAHTF
jgi:hypothetical protein